MQIETTIAQLQCGNSPVPINNITSGTEKVKRDHLCKNKKAVKLPVQQGSLLKQQGTEPRDSLPQGAANAKCLLESLDKHLNEKTH